jgi:hypothetical protein
LKQPPQAPRYLTRAEVNANRVAAAKRRQITRTNFIAQMRYEVLPQFPYKVCLDPSRYMTIDKFAIRQWFKSQGIPVYEPSTDNRDRARVMFDDTWREFRFARESDSVLFQLCWC